MVVLGGVARVPAVPACVTIDQGTTQSDEHSDTVRPLM